MKRPERVAAVGRCQGAPSTQADAGHRNRTPAPQQIPQWIFIISVAVSFLLAIRYALYIESLEIILALSESLC